MKKINKLIFSFNVIVCALSIAVIAFTIIVLGWKPCPMCLLQQLCVLIIFTVSLLGWIKSDLKSLNIAIRILVMWSIIFGACIAANQTYIQYFQTISTIDNSSCSAVINPFLIEATKTIVGTIQNCSDIKEKISGISLTTYSFVFFICLFVINTISFFVNLSKKK
jgi:disulfide bond formation protein DsbB